MQYPLTVVTSAPEDGPWLVHHPVTGLGDEQFEYGAGEPPDRVISDEVSVGFFLKLVPMGHQHCLCSRAHTVLTFKPCTGISILYRALQRPDRRRICGDEWKLEIPKRTGGWARCALDALYQYRGIPYVATEVTEVGWVRGRRASTGAFLIETE